MQIFIAQEKETWCKEITMRLRKLKHRGACNATIKLHDKCLSKYVYFIFQFFASGDKKIKKRMSRLCVA